MRSPIGPRGEAPIEWALHEVKELDVDAEVARLAGQALGKALLEMLVSRMQRAEAVRTSGPRLYGPRRGAGAPVG